MNRYYIVKEYIYYHMYQRRLTRDEFCKVCNISVKDFIDLENNEENFNRQALNKISDYIHIPINLLYIDLDNFLYKPFVDKFDKEVQERENKRKNSVFYFD